MRLRRRSNRIAALPTRGPNRHKHRDLPPAFIARMSPPRPLDPRTLEKLCLRGLSTRQMAVIFQCHCSHTARQLRKHGLQTVAAALRAQAPAPLPAQVAAPQLCNIDPPPSASPQNRSGAQHHSGVEAGRSGGARTLLSFEEPECAALSVPPHLRRDVATLNRHPRLSLHRRAPAVRRLARWFIAEQAWWDAERALRRYKTALRANQHGRVPYRLARRVQDEMYGGRIGRGQAWS